MLRGQVAVAAVSSKLRIMSFLAIARCSSSCVCTLDVGDAVQFYLQSVMLCACLAERALKNALNCLIHSRRVLARLCHMWRYSQALGVVVYVTVTLRTWSRALGQVHHLLGLHGGRGEEAAGRNTAVLRGTSERK
jgi:hypothetical protein